MGTQIIWHFQYQPLEVILLCLLIIVSILLLVKYTRSERWLSAGILICITSLVLLIWTDPKRVTTTTEEQKPSLSFTILQDTSASMNTANLAKEFKYQTANKQRERIIEQIHSYDPNAEITQFSFSSVLQANISKDPPTGNTTYIYETLEQLLQQNAEEASNADQQWLFLLSDGECNELNLDREGDILRKLEESNYQIFSLPPTGNYLPKLTVTVGQLISPNIVLTDQNFSVTFKIRSRVFSNQKIKLLLTQNGEQIHIEDIMLKRSGVHNHSLRLLVKNQELNEFTIHLLPQDPRIEKSSFSFLIKGEADANKVQVEKNWLHFNQQILSPGESVTIHSELNEPNIEYKIKLPARNEYTKLPDLNDGILTVPLLSRGQYEFAIFKKNQPLSQQLINILPYSLEEEFSGVNHSFLKQLSSKTNGTYVDSNEILTRLFTTLEKETKTLHHQRETSLVYKPTALILLSFLLFFLWILDRIKKKKLSIVS